MTRRADVTLNADVHEATVLDDLIDDAAVQKLYAHHVEGPPDLRRRILYVAHKALALACATQMPTPSPPGT